MATDIGDLVEQLLFDVAITGSRGLGVEEIDQTITNHHDQLNLAAPANTGVSDGNAGSSIQAPALATFKASVWKRLQEHPDAIVETSDTTTPPHDDGASDEEALQPAAESTEVPVWIHATEERKWQAIAGHEVDHKRLAPRLFEIVEVVAAAGPEGILQPEVTRLTGQDKHSIPLRTDKLADRGYITKERLAMPKITSRLRLWRFSASQSATPDHGSEGNDTFDHGFTFDKMIKVLQDNDGVATLKDIQLETGCTETTKRKALSKRVVRLQKVGLLQKIMAKVQGEKMVDGSDRYSRCLKLLRAPLESDRVATMATGGPVKLDALGRTRTQLAMERGFSSPGNLKRFEDKIEDLNDDDIAELDEQQWQAMEAPAVSATTMVDSQGQERDVPQERNVSDTAQPANRRVSSGVRSSSLIAPRDQVSTFGESPRSTKRRRISSSKAKENQDVPQQPGSVSSARNTGASKITQGVYFRPPSPRKKKKLGRPRKSLIAVIKSDRLNEQLWFQDEGVPNAANVPARDGAHLPRQTSGDVDTRSSMPSSGAIPADADVTAVTDLEDKVTSTAQPATPTSASKRSLGQRRRWDKIFAERAAKAQEAVPARAVSEQTPLNQVQHKNGMQLTDDTFTRSTVALGPTFVGDPPNAASTPEELDPQAAQMGHLQLMDTPGGGGLASDKQPSTTTDRASSSWHNDSAATSTNTMSGLPMLQCVPFEDEEYANAPNNSVQSKRVKSSGGPLHEQRCNLLINVVRAVGGIFPNERQLYTAFVSRWQETRSGTPATGTVSKVIEALRKEGRLRKYEFECANTVGAMKTHHIFTEPHIDVSSPRLREVQMRVIEALPKPYVPGSIQLIEPLQTATPAPGLSQHWKHNFEDDGGFIEPRKRRRLSAESFSNAEFLGEGGNDDYNEDYDMPQISARNDHDWRDNFPRANGVAVKRTAAGLEHARAEAQRHGFLDASARVQAITELGAAEYRRLRKDAMNTGRQISTEDVRSMGRDRELEDDPGAEELGSHAITNMSRPGGPAAANMTLPLAGATFGSVEPLTKREGWPRGTPRGAKERSITRGLDVAPLLSLLFYPVQVYHQSSGTIGTNIGELNPVSADSGKSPAAASAGTTSRKRPAVETETLHQPPAGSLLMAPVQTAFTTFETIGTGGTAEPPTTPIETGRGKRIKRSTEKVADSSRVQTSPSAVKASRPTAEFTPAPLPTLTPTPTPMSTSRRQPAYSKSELFDDPDWHVSTDYANNHPEETWYHRGHGRWARGLPPEGSSYKTAVKGPGAAAYLASIKTLEGKPKQHGLVVNGIQTTRNGEPWKKQPVTVNGVRVRPVDDIAASSSSLSRARPSSQANGVAPVQYDVPSPSPTPYQPIVGPTAGTPSQPLTSVSTSISTTQSTMQAIHGSLANPQGAMLPPTRPASSTPAPPQPSVGTKRKRPYTYKARKPLSAVGPDGVPIELDRDSDEDYTQSGSPKKPRKQAPTKASPAKAKYSIDRNKLSMAVALVKNMTTPASKDIQWDLVGAALQSDDKGAAAEKQFRRITSSATHAQLVTDLEEGMQEPFLSALEKGELGAIDLTALTKVDWAGLLRWAELNVVPIVSAESTPSAYDVTQAAPFRAVGQKVKGKPGPKPERKAQANKTIVDAAALFPATYDIAPKDPASTLDLHEALITTKSWIRANSATKNELYDTAKATEKLTALGPEIVRAVQEMQQTNTIRQLKGGRRRPGRNFEITQRVWEQFRRWPGDANAPRYLHGLLNARSEVLRHFAEMETFEMSLDVSEQKSLILSSMVSQGMLKIEVQLPPRNDDIDAPGPKLNAWSYCGPRHDTRKIERSAFDLPVVYSKTPAFTNEHHLRTDVPFPGLPDPLPNETLPRVPFWIDIHGNSIPEIWETVLSSVIFLLMRKPGITAKGIEKAHTNKLWLWEIKLALEWMEKVGIAERLGGGKEVDGEWKGGWTVGEEWYCAFAPDVAAW